MGIEEDKTRKILDGGALIVVCVIATSFGVTLFIKNWQYGTVFYLILFFVILGFKKGWFKDKVFHD